MYICVYNFIEPLVSMLDNDVNLHDDPYYEKNPYFFSVSDEHPSFVEFRDTRIRARACADEQTYGPRGTVGNSRYTTTDVPPWHKV